MESEEISKPSYKIYKPAIIGACTFLGGPLAGAYMISENFFAFGQRRNFWLTWASTVLLMIVFSFIHVLLESWGIQLSLLILFLYAGISTLITSRLQAEDLFRHAESNGEYFSIINALGVSLVSAIVNLLLVIGLIELLQG
jgi:FlaA1/EpsC-like NDP-sugar epimerase